MVGVLTLAMASCGGAEPIPPTGIPTPTEQPATLSPTAVPTPITSPVRTATSVPTPTPVLPAATLAPPTPTLVPATPTRTLPTPTFFVPIPTSTAPAPVVPPTPLPESCTDVHETPIISGPSGPAGPDRDSVFRSLTVHPTDPAVVVLGTERNGFVRSDDGGLTWTRLRAGLRSDPGSYPEVWDIDISPSDPSVMMAATLDSPGPILGTAPTVHAGIYRSTDGGQSWTQLNCGFTTSRATSVRFHPDDPAVAVVGLEGGEASYSGSYGGYYPGGIFRTEDAGTSWQRVEVGENDERNGFTVMTVVPTTPPTFITFGMNYDDLTQNLGFIRSADIGKTWQFFGDELRNRRISSFTVSSDGQTMYANEDGTYFGWISHDAGETWSRSAVVQVTGPIAVSPDDPNLVIFGSPGELRRSTDGLQNISVVATVDVTFREIVFAPSRPSTVYAEADGYILYRSDDSGATWRLVASVRDDVLNVQG